MMPHTTKLNDLIVDRLGTHVSLSDADRDFAVTHLRGRLRTVPARQDVCRTGGSTRDPFLILDGWACRSTTLPDGRRQITGLLLPGDFCALETLICDDDEAVTALSPLTIIEIARERVRYLSNARPTLAQAFWSHAMIWFGIQRAWIVNLGQRTASERLSHLLCELFYRLRAVARAGPQRCELPLTQSDLADALGLTSVHVNRTLQTLRRRELISVHNREIVFLDIDALMREAMFDPTYLHLANGGRIVDLIQQQLATAV